MTDRAARETLEEVPPALASLRSQDAAAFEWLVARTRRIILGLGQSLGLRGPDLDDAAAEVYLAVYRALPSFNGDARVTTWVYPIAVRTLTRCRTRSRSHRPTSLNHDVVAPPASDGPGEHDEARAIWSAVARLDPRAAMAVELHYRRGLSIDDVAAALCCPANTVKTILHRARAELRETLKTIGADE